MELEKIRDISFIMIIFSFSVLVVAIVTKDPFFDKFGVPLEFEWIIGLFIAGLSSWKLYFNPMKNSRHNVEKDMIGLEKDVSFTKEELKDVKISVNKHEKEINNINSILIIIKNDLGIIKEKLLGPKA